MDAALRLFWVALRASLKKKRGMGGWGGGAGLPLAAVSPPLAGRLRPGESGGKPSRSAAEELR